MVIEDSATTRKVITITLAQQGYETIEARDGLEALSCLNETRPDLILLDIILPKMDGYKVLNIIKENHEFRDIPVIMLTSKDGFLNNAFVFCSLDTSFKLVLITCFSMCPL